MTDMRRDTKFLVLVAAIAAILYVLISPLPEPDAVELAGVVTITLLVAFSDPKTSRVLAPNPASRSAADHLSVLKGVPDLLTILCVRHC